MTIDLLRNWWKRHHRFRKPFPPTRFRLRFNKILRSTRMQAVLTWTPSTDPSVQGQMLHVTANGTDVFNDHLGATVATYVFTCNEGDVIHADLYAYNNSKGSPVISVDGTAPVSTVPVAPSALVLTFTPTAPTTIPTPAAS